MYDAQELSVATEESKKNKKRTLRHSFTHAQKYQWQTLDGPGGREGQQNKESLSGRASRRRRTSVVRERLAVVRETSDSRFDQSTGRSVFCSPSQQPSSLSRNFQFVAVVRSQLHVCFGQIFFYCSRHHVTFFVRRLE